jgi:selenocysteine lyase/cysteine desulfurase
MKVSRRGWMKATVSAGRMRVSSSVYNTQGDVDALLEALS